MRGAPVTGDVASYFGVHQHLTGMTVGDDSAAIKGRDPRGVALHNIHVMFNKHYGDWGLLTMGFNRLHDRIHGLKLFISADAARGLIEQEQAGMAKIGRAHV